MGHSIKSPTTAPFPSFYAPTLQIKTRLVSHGSKQKHSDFQYVLIVPHTNTSYRNIVYYAWITEKSSHPRFALIFFSTNTPYWSQACYPCTKVTTLTPPIRSNCLLYQHYVSKHSSLPLHYGNNSRTLIPFPSFSKSFKIVSNTRSSWPATADHILYASATPHQFVHTNFSHGLCKSTQKQIQSALASNTDSQQTGSHPQLFKRFTNRESLIFVFCSLQFEASSYSSAFSLQTANCLTICDCPEQCSLYFT